MSRPNLRCPHKSGSAVVVSRAQNTPIHTGTRNTAIALPNVLDHELSRLLAVSITDDDMRDLPQLVRRAAPPGCYRDDSVAWSVSVKEPSRCGGLLSAPTPRTDWIRVTTAVSALLTCCPTHVAIPDTADSAPSIIRLVAANIE